MKRIFKKMHTCISSTNSTENLGQNVQQAVDDWHFPQNHESSGNLLSRSYLLLIVDCEFKKQSALMVGSLK